MHDVVTEYFEPNADDITAGIQGSFGTTTNIINGGAECGWAAPNAVKRGEYYQAFRTHFGITDNSEDNLACAGESGFPPGSAGALPSYFTHDWTWGNETKCMLVTW